MRERYVEKNFKPETEAIIHAANKIIAEYAAQGFSLTLRQLYYQFVGRMVEELLRHHITKRIDDLLWIEREAKLAEDMQTLDGIIAGLSQ